MISARIMDHTNRARIVPVQVEDVEIAIIVERHRSGVHVSPRDYWNQRTQSYIKRLQADKRYTWILVIRSIFAPTSDTGCKRAVIRASCT